MIKRRLTQILALLMIGEAVVALSAPRRHAKLRHVGPRRLKRLVRWFGRNPGTTRALAVAEGGFGTWLAVRQLRR